MSPRARVFYPTKCQRCPGMRLYAAAACTTKCYDPVTILYDIYNLVRACRERSFVCNLELAKGQHKKRR